uniref:Uncharacterized protein n=1 Tax=Meloidogyne javanica TaxID=6303 RepID=A0A915MHH5_MELJA
MASTVSTNKSKLELAVHQVEPAIVVRYIDERANDNNSSQLKIIQLKGLTERSNPNAVACFVQDQCQPLIPIDRLSELEQLISSIIWRGRSSEIKVSSYGSADIEKLDVKLLYDEGESKNQGISLLLQLVCETSPSNLPKIVENEPLMGALVRVMKEDARRNFDLAIQVGQLFHRLSQFSPFLPILSRWKIGLLSLQLVEQELRRSEVWREKVKELSDLNSRRNWESALIKQDLLITVCLQILLNMSEDLRIENKMQRKGLLNLLFNALEHSSSSKLNNSGAIIERLISFIPPLTTSNNRPSSSKENETEILFPLFSLLFNCSFELTSRRRMVQCGLVSLLAPYICDFNIALALMYQLSMEEDAKAMIAFTDCISIIARNIATHEGPTREMFGKWMPKIVENFITKNLFGKFFDGNLNKFGVINDDLVLQAVMFCGTLASHNLQMAEKVEKDDEIILQSIFGIICLFSYGGNLAKRLCIEENEESIIGILLNFLHNKNPKICQLCDKALEKAAVKMVKQATTNEQLNNSEYDKLFEDEYILPSGLVLDSEELLRDSEFLNSVVAPIQRR